MSEEKVRTEEFSVNGEDLLGKIKEIIHEGNIRRIIIKKKGGDTVMEIPMTSRGCRRADRPATGCYWRYRCPGHRSNGGGRESRVNKNLTGFQDLSGFITMYNCSLVI